MKAFAALYTELDASTSVLHKLAALERYLRAAAPDEAAWAVYLLAGGKPRQTVPSRVLREAARSAARLPEWLFEESYQAVGDLAETIARLLPPPSLQDEAGLAEWMTVRLPGWRGQPPEVLQSLLIEAWEGLDGDARFLLCKLITGGFRVGVSRQRVLQALARVADLDEKRLAQRLIGYTDARTAPDAARYLALIAPATETSGGEAGLPYPFFLAHPLQALPESLGSVADWQAEWKWDGIRAQVVLRAGGVWIWSRGEELVTDRFPEIARAGQTLAAAVDAAGRGLVLDGELLAWDATRARPHPFARLQTRITRKTLSAAVLRSAPVVFMAYDLLESEGIDRRTEPLAERRRRLEALVPQTDAAEPLLRASPRVEASDWAGLAQRREQARAHGVEGLMLKPLGAAYGIGRTRTEGGEWWKWKLDPYTVDAVLIYAQRGHGRRASLYTDYTFAVWDRAPDDRTAPRSLLPFAKAYSGLSDAEIRAVDAHIRRTTVESFGPVRSVRPTLVFELGFEGIAPSPRHKAGIAVRFPRMLRWRQDKPVEEADHLGTLRAMLAPGESA